MTQRIQYCWTALVLVTFFVGSPAAAEPKIVIDPSEPVILGDKVGIRLEGFPPGADVMLRGETAGPRDKLIRSEVVFKVDPNGKVYLDRRAPSSGSYRGIDPLGIFWSLNDTQDPIPESLQPVKDQSRMRFSALIDGKELARIDHVRYLVRPGVKKVPVRDGGMIATMFMPPGDKPRAGVVLLGGSSGGIGWQERMGGLLASHGFATLAVAYFGMDDLPDHLELIPLEYFTGAVDWLRKHPGVDSERVGVMGVSKGAELALLLGSKLEQIRAVVAYVPSSVVWQSIKPGFPVTSSWTENGAPLPFVPYNVSQEFLQSGLLVKLYDASLTNKEAINKAAIATEKTQGPVLLISGEDDAVWPSTRMADGSLLRMTATRHPYEDAHLKYEDAGHGIAGPGYSRSTLDARRGGTRPGNAFAAADSWTQMLAFLKRSLRQND